MEKILAFFLLFTACGKQNQTSRFFLSNMGQPDNVVFKIIVNEEMILLDTVVNEHISYHWTEFEVELPKKSFKLGIDINTKNFTIRKDTVLESSPDSLFITYNFTKYYKRYTNPEIFTHMEDREVNAQSFADSLYANNVLSNAAEYLNDTLPSSRNIEILVK